MATCGYICPSCGGTGIDSEGNDCQWCIPAEKPSKEKSEPEVQDLNTWIKDVHEGKCCSD